MGNNSSRPRVVRAPNPTPAAQQPVYSQPQIYASPAAQGAIPPYSNGQYFGGFPTPAYNSYYGGNTYGQPPTMPGQYGQPPKPTPQQEFQTTQTIRNQVNLKKNTLKLVPLPDQPDVLSIQFHFDSSAPCRVSTFILASEDSKNRCQLTTQQLPAEPVYYDRGLERHFPPDSNEAVTRSHVVSTSLHTPELTSVQGNRFPLIIRLETLTDDGRKEGKDLKEVPAGSAFPQFVQSQTTYAHFVKEEDGTWEVRIVKQKIWVKGVSYELQEIYGMEQNKGASKSSGTDELDGRDCVICMNADRDTTVLPCRHMCMCNDCARALKTQTNKCPICRNEIESLLHIKIQNNTAASTAAVSESNAAVVS